MLRILLVTAAAAVAIVAAQPALAADLPEYQPAPSYAAPAPSTWTGGYVGAQAGYGWGRSHNGAATSNSKPKGGLVGAYAGYDYQFDNSPVVVGVDTDLNWNNASDRKHFGPNGSSVKNELNWSGATRARIGYGSDRVLVYGAAGVAYGGYKMSRRQGPAPSTHGSDDKTAVGWTAGGGVEAKLAENVTARAEYRYSDYGSDKFEVAGGKVKSNLTENRLTAGVAYKFSGW